MNNYKPFAYLYKNDSDPGWLKSCFVVMIPSGKKLTLRSGDPSIDGNKVHIRYDIEDDATQTQRRQEEFVNQFAWDGSQKDVEVIVGDGSSEGGRAVISSDNAELD